MLLIFGWVAMRGHLWAFEQFDQHRFTARAILTGTLKLHGGVSIIENDEQVFNGSAYTNWGYGVPLLQAPFHALAAVIGAWHGFFPDRAIYFLYFAGAAALLWPSFDRLVFDRVSGENSLAERRALSWAAIWLTFNLALFPLTAYRFIIYEETIAYFVLSQLVVISAYIIASRSWNWSAVLGMGAAAGVGLLIRPPGVAYAAAWALIVAVEGRSKRALLFLVAVAPFFVFWLYSNWVKTGSCFAFGYSNSTPAFTYHVPMQRFGSRCADTPTHALLAGATLFTAFFFIVGGQVAWLRNCHFDLVTRIDHFPFFGPVVFCAMGWTLHRLLSRRDRRVTRYAPYLLMTALFAAYAWQGVGFQWRYAGDFWPAIVLACVHQVQDLRTARPMPVSAAALSTRIMCWYGLIELLLVYFPLRPPETIPVTETASMLERFRVSRWGTDPPVAHKLSCGDPIAPIYQNGLGWKEGCAVDTFTNVFLGVVPKHESRAGAAPHASHDHYWLLAKTEGMSASTLRVYLNGKIYLAQKKGDTYAADVTIPFAALGSWVVLVTVEWARDFDPPESGKLLSIELV
jgi:hypothetical protein